MIDREFDDLYYIEDPDYDDTVISDDSFSEIFGTPDMFRPDTSRRYNKSELESLSVKERYEERLKCAKEKNSLGQRDIFTFDFQKFGVAASGNNLIAISFLYAKTHAEEEFFGILRKAFLFELNDEARHISEFMFEIGLKYPNLNNDELNQLELLYNNTKYCALIDELLFDKEKLPRTIRGITREELNRRNDNFPDSLLDQVYHAFEENSEVDEDNEDTIWRVYDRRNNIIISKAYKKLGAGEIIADGTIEAFIFFNLIEEKYGEECLYFFVKKVMQLNPYLKDVTPERFRSLKSQWVEYWQLSNFAKERWGTQEVSQDIKHLIALSFLLRVNKKEQ